MCDVCGASFSQPDWEQAAWKHFKPKVIVVLEGGLVTGILSTTSMEAKLLDYDVEGEDGPLVPVPQTAGQAGRSALARLTAQPVEVNEDRTRQLWDLMPSEPVTADGPFLDVLPASKLAAANALQESIEHWKRLRDFTIEKRRTLRSALPEDESIGAIHCALCEAYRFPASHTMNCAGCPVFKATGLRYCEGSPYNEAAAVFYDAPDEEWRALADKEIEFLESLQDD